MKLQEVYDTSHELLHKGYVTANRRHIGYNEYHWWYETVYIIR